jgi:hypothetical protein
MIRTAFASTERAIGPCGKELTLADLPPSDTTRWVARRKAEVVAAVSSGLLTMSEACERYQMDLEELVSWQRAVDHNGLSGLKVKGLQEARRGEAKRRF